MSRINKKRLKVLLIGQNYASTINSLAIGLRQLDTFVKVVSFEESRSKYNNYDQFDFVLKQRKPGRWGYYKQAIKCSWHLFKLLLWADVVHVFYVTRNNSFDKFDLWLIGLLGKKRLVTFLGSELRIPEISMKNNIYFEQAYNHPGYEYKHSENAENSIRLQKGFAHYNFEAIVWELEDYIIPGLFKRTHIIPHASVNSAKSHIIKEDKSYLRVVHSPSAPIAKGTFLIVPILEEICRKEPRIQFDILQNITNAEYQQKVANADVFIDQIVWGGYGVAAQQALAVGKVVLANISVHRIRLFGEDCPVQNITLENIESILLRLLNDFDYRKELKEKGVKYYNEMHEPQAVARKMLAVYTNLNS